MTSRNSIRESLNDLWESTRQQLKKKIADKHFTDLSMVDTLIELDDQRKKAQHDYDNTQAKLNLASKQIGALMAKGSKEEAEQLKAEVIPRHCSRAQYMSLMHHSKGKSIHNSIHH